MGNWIQEYKESGTIHGWSEEEAEKHENYFIRLALKDARGKATLKEKISLEIDALLMYNNVQHVMDSEVQETAALILKLINKDRES